MILSIKYRCMLYKVGKSKNIKNILLHNEFITEGGIKINI